MCYATKRESNGIRTLEGSQMGDSYREELKRHHKKSGFGPNPARAENAARRALYEDGRALWINRFKKKTAKQAQRAAATKRLM